MAMTIVYPVENKLYVNLTNKCPCSCTFCIRQNGDCVYGSDNLWLEHEPSLDEVKKALTDADYKKYNEIVFCGYGEPTERLDCLTKTASFIKQTSDVKTRLNTNGLCDLINGDGEKTSADKFEGLIDTVSISLNAGTEEEYMKVTRPKFGEGSFKAMQKFAQQCRKYVPNVVFTVVDVIGEEEIAAAQKIADELNIPLRVRKYEG